MKILVLHPGALGDLILSLPALGALRQGFPQAEITFAGNLDFLEAVSHLYADRVISLSTLPLHRLYALGPLSQDDALFWKSYDRILSWTGAGHVRFTQNLIGANPSARIASYRPSPNERRHVSQIFMDSPRSWLSNPQRLAPAKIYLSNNDRCRGESWLRGCGWMPGKKVVAMHAGAGSPIKRWSVLRFRALAKEISSRLADHLLLLEGPAELSIAHEVLQDLPDSGYLLAQSLPLGQLAGVLSYCRAFIGNDSGVAHLAAALGVPSVVLFGPTSPDQWAPQGKHVSVLRDIRGCVACKSGIDHGHSCLENISVKRCLAALEKIGGWS